MFSAKILAKLPRSEQCGILVDYWRNVPLNSASRFLIYFALEFTNLVNVIFQGSKLHSLPC